MKAYEEWAFQIWNRNRDLEDALRLLGGPEMCACAGDIRTKWGMINVIATDELEEEHVSVTHLVPPDSGYSWQCGSCLDEDILNMFWEPEEREEVKIFNGNDRRHYVRFGEEE